MELKYYLRGLGLGIVVTAIIMGIASSRNSTMTDEEVIERAKQLGMIEDRVLSEAAAEDAEISDKGSGDGGNAAANENGPVVENSSTLQNEVQNENTPPDETVPVDGNGTVSTDGNDAVNGSEEENAAETSAAVLPDDEETGQEETPPEPEEPEAEIPPDNTDSGASMIITVGSGDGSYTVSKKLEDAGAVASASAFDTFLCENGYDKRIRAGSYTIPAGAGNEQIARMITGGE